nr:MAG: RNA-dependent RNA polymerase [Totiviridae sp.]
MDELEPILPKIDSFLNIVLSKLISCHHSSIVRANNIVEIRKIINFCFLMVNVERHITKFYRQEVGSHNNICLSCASQARSVFISPSDAGHLPDCPDKEVLPTGPLMHPGFYRPHICSISMMTSVEWLYNARYICKCYYLKWTFLNDVSYQTDASPSCQVLWAHRVLEIDVMPDPTPAKVYDIPTFARIFKCVVHGSLHLKLSQGYAFPSCRDEYKFLNIIFPFSSSGDKKQTNLDLASLVSQIIHLPSASPCLQSAFEAVPIGRSNIWITAFIVSLLESSTTRKLHQLIMQDGACCLSNTQVPKYFKCISVAIRRTQTLWTGERCTSEEITRLAYWELPIGRDINKSDWEKEKRNRTTPIPMKLVLGRPLHHHIEKELLEIINSIARIEMRNESWFDFCERRQEWVAAGSSGGYKLNVPTPSGNKSITVNKPAMFDDITLDQMHSWLYSEPKLEARGSEKFEMGKARAIYGTSPIDYSIMTYCIADLERNLCSIDGIQTGRRGEQETIDIMSRSSRASSNASEATMIDYADFNIQHSLELQAAVFTAMSKSRHSRTMHADHIAALDWCALACTNQWCFFPGDTEPTRVIQGLFSGMRGTDLLNTLLNLAYFRFSARLIEHTFGLRPRRLMNIHKGDDVWIMNESHTWAVVLFNTMKWMGFVFQAGKQLFGRQIGEFLRVLYYQGQARGYLTRCLGTLIIKPLQSSEFGDPSAIVGALTAQIAICHRRGLSAVVCDQVWDAIVPYRSNFRHGHSFHSMPTWTIQGAAIDGAMDSGHVGTIALRTYSRASIPRLETGNSSLVGYCNDNMARDWVRSVARKAKMEFDSNKLISTLHKTNLISSSTDQDKMTSVDRLAQRLHSWIGTETFIDQRHRTRLNWQNLALTKFEKWLVAYVNAIWRFPDRIRGYIAHESLLGIMQAAIASGPFKSLDNLVVALGGSKVDLLFFAIQMTQDLDKKRKALDAYHELTRRLDASELAVILKGTSCYANSFEPFLHPVLISWVCGRLWQHTLQHWDPQWTRGSYQWLERYNSALIRVLTTLASSKNLISSCHY